MFEMSSPSPSVQVEAKDSKQPAEQPLGSKQTSIMASEEAAVSEEKAPEEAPEPVVEYPEGLEVFFHYACAHPQHHALFARPGEFSPRFHRDTRRTRP